MATSCEMTNRSFHPFWLAAGGCFFMTGLSALVCQVCWIRTASLVFGSATWAVSVVLAVFFAGLAVGSLIVGWYSPRVSRPLYVYAWLEIGVGVAAILSPTMFELADLLFGLAYPRVFSSTVLVTLTRAILVALVILPATTLMGGSLPLFCRQYVQDARGIQRGVGLLYGVNTLGAAVGAAACGFWMIPHFGISASIYLAGSLNLLVGVIAFRLSRKLLPLRVSKSTEPGARTLADYRDASPATRAAAAVVAVLFFGVGFVGLANEVLWTRYLSLWMPNTVYTYTMMLTVVLLGIVLGSLLAAVIGDRLRWRAGLFGAAQVANGVAVMGVMQLRPSWWGIWLDPISLGQQLVVIMVVMLLPAVLAGLSFPLAIRLVVRDVSRVGEGTGSMTAVNLAGGIAGSLLTGFAALPLLGLHVTLFLTSGLSLLLGAVAWWTLDVAASWFRRATWTVIAVVLWGAIPYFCRTQLPQDFLASDGTLVDYREGVNANVSVVRQGDTLRLHINRMWQGQNRRNHQVMAAHIPAILHGAPKSVLVIGLGTGQTAGSFLVHDVSRLDCLEIEDGLIDLVTQYFDADWMRDPRVNLIVEDGRAYTTHTRNQYDLISIEVGQIYRPGVASFYTADFYERLGDRLHPQGLVCQFLPTDFFDVQEFRTVVATFLRVFPHSVLWYNTSELLLMGRRATEITLDPDRLTELVAGHARLRQELEYAYWGGPTHFLTRPEVFAAGFLCGPAQLQELAAGGDVYRDDRPYLEYRSLLRPSNAQDIVALLRSHLSPVATLLRTHDQRLLTSSHAIRRQNLQEIVARVAVHRAEALEAADQLDDAVVEYRRALAAMPAHPKANHRLAVLLQSQGQHAAARDLYRRALATNPADVQAQVNLAGLLLLQQQPEQAIEHYQQALAREPRLADVQVRLGWALAMTGRVDEAASCFQEALRWEPELARAHLGLGNVLLSQGKLDQAAESYRRAIQLEPDLAEAHASLAQTLRDAGQPAAAVEHFRQALRRAPDDVRSLTGGAWVLATASDPALRDPQQAVTWAAQAWQLVRGQDPQVADVLAAAYASAGDFARAVDLAEQAIHLAQARNMTDFAQEVELRLARYRRQQPGGP